MSATNSFGNASGVQSIVDLMRETPASIGGTFTLASPVNLMRDTSGMIPKTVELKAKPVGFSFDEDSLTLQTRGALYFWYGGIKCKINQITYSDSTGAFDVSTDTPLGLFDKSLESKIKAAIGAAYKTRLKKAYAELRQIRREQSVDQAKQSIFAVISALTDGSEGPRLPKVTGNVSLMFRPEVNRRIMLTEEMGASVQAGDFIRMSGDFSLTNRKTTFQSLEFESSTGIRINGDTRWPEIKSINLRHMKISPEGISINYAVGAEEVIQGLIVALNLITSSGGRNPTSADCLTEVELVDIRQKIDRSFQGEISKLLREHRVSLINAGVNPQLIDALD